MNACCSRIAAGLISLIAMAGLAIQFDATFAQNASVTGTLWILVRYFTVLANVAIAALFGAIATGRAPSARMIGGGVLAILLVGVVYGLLLRGLLELSGGALLADTLLHKVTPVIAPLWWIAFAAKGRLRQSDPWWWALFPALYLPYALARGIVEGRYAYPFLNVTKIGWSGVALYAAVMVGSFLLAGFALVALDRRLGCRAT
jgi:hypothetical protein